MGSIKVEYLITRTHKGKKRYYWNPNKDYVVAGIRVKCPWGLTALPDNAVDAVNKARGLSEALRAWRDGGDSSAAQEGHIRWLVAKYCKSSRFRELAPATQKLYKWNFPALDCFRRVPVAKITRKMALEFYETLVSTGQKRKPSQVMQIARVVFQYGEDYDIIEKNPFTHLGVTKAKPRRTILTAAQIEAAKIKALALGLPSIARAIQIGFDAGQRPGDIRNLHKGAYDGQWLRVKQSKTGAVVDIPVYKMPALKAELDNMAHDSLLILHEERTKKAYGKDMLCRRAREVFEAAGLGSDIQFRDLRRTAVVRLAEAGCEIPEICAITGHSLKEATEILETYLPRSRKMAENAADKIQLLNKPLA